VYLWIDDERIEPEGWLRSTSCPNAIKIIAAYGSQIKAISFDYDLGPPNEGNGGDVAQYLRDNWQKHGLYTDVAFNIHSGNPPGVRRIRAILEDLYREWKRLPEWVLEKSAAQMWQNSEIPLG